MREGGHKRILPGDDRRDDAIDVLQRLRDTPDAAGASHPMVHYHLGYYRHLQGKDDLARDHYHHARSLPSAYSFPFRPQSIAVLEHASTLDPDDAMSHYYLGNLVFDGQPERGKAEWETARQMDDGIALVHRNLALAYEQLDGDLSKAVNSLERAVECDPTNPRQLYELDVLYEKNMTPVATRLAMVRAYEAVIARRTDALTRKVLVNVQGGAYTEAAARREFNQGLVSLAQGDTAAASSISVRPSSTTQTTTGHGRMWRARPTSSTRGCDDGQRSVFLFRPQAGNLRQEADTHC